MITDCLIRYMARRGGKLSARRTLGYAAQRLIDWWKLRTVADLTEETIDGYRAWRETPPEGGRAPVKPATVNRELAALRAAVRAVWKAGKLTREPAFPRVDGQPGRAFALSWTEVDRLLDAADRAKPHLRLFTYLAFFTAGRHGALLELGWDQVRFGKSPRILLNPEGRKQTKKGRAIVPMAERLATVLTEARAEAERAGGLDLPLVHWRGQPVRSVRKGFRAVVEAAGLPVTGRCRVTPHVLRHTVASLLQENGIGLSRISGFLGHTDQRTTQRYLHPEPDHLEPIRAVLDRRPLRPRVVGGNLAVVIDNDQENGP